jgi:NAD(P)-dependent dehydrogenase (short-subunit alcohol dehydrogenase family)
MSDILSNKTVVVTGGAGGLGKGIATGALEAGANVVIVDINGTLLEQCAAELSSKGPLLAVKADVTCESSAENIFTQTIEKFGGVDALVNNAGVMDTFKPVGDADMAEFERIMAINVKGPIALSKFAIKAFLSKETPSGNIINIGSPSSFRGAIAGTHTTILIQIPRLRLNFL